MDLLADPPASMSASRRSTPAPQQVKADAGPTAHHWHGVLDSAVDAVGHTPLIRLSRFAAAEGIHCNLCTTVELAVTRAHANELGVSVAKTEFFSAGGSIKDRIAKVCMQSCAAVLPV